MYIMNHKNQQLMKYWNIIAASTQYELKYTWIVQ